MLPSFGSPSGRGPMLEQVRGCFRWAGNDSDAFGSLGLAFPPPPLIAGTAVVTGMACSDNVVRGRRA